MKKLVAWLIVLPGPPRTPSSCAFGWLPVADVGDVRVAEAVDLRWRPSSRGGGRPTACRTRCGTGSTPRSACRCSPIGSSLADEERLAVADQQVGLERARGRVGRRASGSCPCRRRRSRRRRGTPRRRRRRRRRRARTCCRVSRRTDRLLVVRFAIRPGSGRRTLPRRRGRRPRWRSAFWNASSRP